MTIEAQDWSVSPEPIYKPNGIPYGRNEQPFTPWLRVSPVGRRVDHSTWLSAWVGPQSRRRMRRGRSVFFHRWMRRVALRSRPYDHPALRCD